MALHPLKQALKSNKPAFGAWLTLPGTFHARTVAKSSSDLSWIAVDCEHGLIPLLPAAAESIAAIEGARPGGGPSAIVRIPATGVTNSSSWQIKYALDGGARGVIVPLVYDPAFPSPFASVKSALRCRRPPRLERSWLTVASLP